MVGGAVISIMSGREGVHFILLSSPVLPSVPSREHVAPFSLCPLSIPSANKLDADMFCLNLFTAS